MEKIDFQCDYLEGCHPAILQVLQDSNLEQTAGYGNDPYCVRAAMRIREACACEAAEVHFLVGGTQTNLLAISALLRPYQGVLCAEEGHIATHETGAIEATGHKVLTLPDTDGRITAAQVEAYCRAHWESTVQEHTVQPGMVYLSQPTECGTLYTRAELAAMHIVCQKYGLPLYVDGARLGYALATPENDVTLANLAELADLFYIGGTKCGAMFGEALVIANPAYQKDFRYMIKQRGALLAKGRLLGIQFDTLFAENRYVDICRQAVAQAAALREAFRGAGIPLFGQSPTNQVFPILTKAQAQALSEKYVYSIWGAAADGRTVVRFCTSWATRLEDIEALCRDIAAL